MDVVWRGGAAVVIALVAGVTTGCASGAPAGPPLDEAYVCGGEPIAADAYAAGHRADGLQGHARALVDAGTDDLGAPVVPDDLSSWVIIAESSSRVVLIRELAEPRDVVGMGELHDHELYVVMDDFAPDLPVYGQLSTCALERDASPWGRGLLQRNPDDLPAPGDTEISLLITEWACNSGKDAASRVHVISIDESDEAVTCGPRCSRRTMGAS